LRHQFAVRVARGDDGGYFAPLKLIPDGGDTLGKGTSGAAVQNLNLMPDMAEKTSLAA
jgi:hypothetical protein